MFKVWILLFLCISVVGADNDGHVQWNEHIALCRSPISYRTREHIKTALECKDICAEDRHCLMVKYCKRRKKCWLSDNKSLRPSTKCTVKYDFYIKVAPIPRVLWMKGLYTCKQDKPYKTWFIETAHECRTTCAEEERCKMVKYSPEERKCFFSSSTELKSYNKCMVKYDFYTKVPRHPNMNWIEYIKLCHSITPYEVTSAYTEEHCKFACAKDNKCSMVMYDSEQYKCWKSSSHNMKQPRKCESRYNFYQKDICATMKKACKNEELCLNNGRNYSCLVECPEGHYEEEQICKDVNECSDKPGLCGKNSECFNTLGSYKCICDAGYEWNRTECLDINECSKMRDICGQHAVCKNTIGSYKCSCRSGFKNIGNLCVDMDECRMDLSICPKLAKCINTVGGYQCDSLDDPGNQPSEEHAALSIEEPQMLNSRGGDSWSTGNSEEEEEEENSELGTDYPEMNAEYPEIQVEYPTEYHPAMQTESLVVPVTKTPEVILRELWISHLQLCLSIPHYEIRPDVKSERQCRSQCEQQKKCVMVRYDPSSGKCWLSRDRKMTPKAGCNKLFDYYIKGRNECKGKRGKCHRNAVCKATGGHRTCQCAYGFKGDGWSCKDINECSYYKKLCGKNAHCVNTIGGYSCKCKRGFERKDGICRKLKKGGSSVQDSKSLNDIIFQWKREHTSVATSGHATSAWILISAFLLTQVFLL